MKKFIKPIFFFSIVFLTFLFLIQCYLIYIGKNNSFIGTWQLSSASFQIPGLSPKKSSLNFQNGIEITFTSTLQRYTIPVGRCVFSFSGLAFGGGFYGIYGNSKKYLYADIQFWNTYFTKVTFVPGLSLDDMMLLRVAFSRIIANSTYKIHNDTLTLSNNGNSLVFVKLD